MQLNIACTYQESHDERMCEIYIIYDNMSDMTIDISLQRGDELGRTPLEELS